MSYTLRIRPSLERAESGEDTPELVADAQAVDWGLHDTIIDALENKIIGQVYRVNSIKIRLIRQELTRIDGSLVLPVMREHLAIIEQLVARDRDRCVGSVERSYCVGARACSGALNPTVPNPTKHGLELAFFCRLGFFIG